MNKPSVTTFTKGIVAIVSALTILSCHSEKKSKFPGREEREERKKTGARQALERDTRMMKDPALGYVPAERLIAARRYRDQLIAQRTGAAISGVEWNELGPNNQGGRSRTLLVDANDVTGNTVFAGSVGGGLWKTTNINAAQPNWAPVNDLLGNLAVICIAQDPVTPQTLYLATGEGYFNIDAIRGLGVWKSTDGGSTWNQLASTNNSSYYYCQKVAVNSTGVLFVCTSTGLYRSANGGTSFTKVLGTGLGITGATNNFSYDVEIAANGDVYGTLDGSVHKSVNAGVTFGAAQTLPIAAGRIELACAPSDANYVYAICENGNVVAGILRTVDGGTNWVARTEPDDADTGIPNTDFSRGQAWYDLSIAVNPSNRDQLFVGGIDIFRSSDGGGTWSQMTHWYGGFGFQYAHADQHYVVFRPGSSTTAYFTNDGGVYQTTNATAATPSIIDKGANYRTAQFYACAIHPTAQNPFFLAGAQDNGSHRFTTDVIQGTTQVTGGDGAFCHIDQDQPQYMFTSYVYNDFYRSSDGGNSWTNVSTTGGDFISPTDYDDANNRLYMCDANNTYRRWDNPQTGSTFAAVTATALNGFVSAVRVSPNTANRVFFGSQTGRVIRADNAHTATPTITNISTGLPGGYVTSVEVETGNDNHLLVTYSNYGLTSIYESTNGGTSWTAVEGNLPDMPVRWALFNPNNSDQAMIATELGVWTTDDLNAGSTVWGSSNSGLANVRVDMLQLRQSDKIVIAATHGRGLYWSDAFAAPTARFEAGPKVVYKGMNVNFSSTSYKSSSWNWDFGDATNSTTENPVHPYATDGKYNVTLTINGGASSLTKNQFIHVLPNKGTPYTLAGGGDVESNFNDIGVNHIAGTTWERGNSAVAGKNGTHSGTNAWVTGLTGNYADNSESFLYLPNYNFTIAGTYTFRFWSKFSTEPAYDGFRVEYTTDKGLTWLPLGTTTAAGWYNFANTAGDASFPVNEAFFAGNATTYTQYSRDVSFLAGNTNVAFRFHFKSDVAVTGVGVNIDDVEILGPVNLVLPASLLNFTASRSNGDVLLNWKTTNEFNLSGYTVEKSVDGNNFTPLGTITARNAADNSYSYTDFISQQAVRPSGDLFYRLKITDRDQQYRYSNVARINWQQPDKELVAGPNPFIDRINLYTPGVVKMVKLFTADGREVFRTQSVNGNAVTLSKNLAAGNYILQVETSEGVFSRKLTKQ